MQLIGRHNQPTHIGVGDPVRLIGKKERGMVVGFDGPDHVYVSLSDGDSVVALTDLEMAFDLTGQC